MEEQAARWGGLGICHILTREGRPRPCQGCRAHLASGLGFQGKRGRHQPSPAATNSGNPASAGPQTRGFSPGSWHCPLLLQSFLCTAAGRSSYSSTPSLPSPAHTSSRAPTVLRIKPALQTPGPTGSAPCAATAPAKRWRLYG